MGDVYHTPQWASLRSLWLLQTPAHSICWLQVFGEAADAPCAQNTQ